MNRERKALAYLGPETSFTHEVALGLQSNHPLYRGMELKKATSIATVCQMVAEGVADSGVVPLENSTDNRPVNETITALVNSSLYIRGESTIPISQSAYFLYDVDPLDIEWVITKDSAWGQVRRNAARLFPNARFDPRDSTAAAILEAAQDPTKVGIGPKITGDYYRLLDKMARIDNIHDNPLNATRFIVVDTKDNEMPPTGHDKTSLIAHLPDEPGSLFGVLDIFLGQNINLTKIKSFRKDATGVEFLMELEKHRQDSSLSSALDSLLKRKVGVKILGSYPKNTYQPPKTRRGLDWQDSIEQLRGEVANGVNHQEKTVVAFTLLDRVGALRYALEPFRDINLTEIDSLPTGRLGEYIFYLSFENGVNKREQALEELRSHCSRLVLI